MLTRKLFVSGFALLALSAQAARTELRVMGYNVQNLFDTVDNPKTLDEEFTPGGLQHWTEIVLEDKMRNLGEVIRNADADIVGLVEVEHEAVVKDFVRTGLPGAGYAHVAVADTVDIRGIRPALLSKYPIVEQRSHRISSPSWIENGKRKYGRDILEVTLDTEVSNDEGRYVTVLVSHWLSKGGGPIRDKWREDEARSMSEIISGIVRRNPGRLVISIGDFNDTLDSRPLNNGLPLVSSLEAFAKSSPEKLYAADSELAGLAPQDRGTHYFHPDKSWNTLDHVFIAEGATLKAGRTRGFHYRPQSMKVIKPRFQNQGDSSPKGCEIIRGQKQKGGFRTRCLDGASDHRPVTADFDLR